VRFGITPLRAAWVVASLSLVVQWIHAMQTDIDARAHDRYGRDTRSAVAADARLNQQIMQSRQALVTHYDALTHTSSELRETYARLQAPPTFLEDVDSSEIRALATESVAAFNEKSLAVEHFKSENAILRNSARFFPLAAEELRARKLAAGDLEGAELVTQLLLAIRSHIDLAGLAELERAELAIEALEASGDTSEDTTVVLLHAVTLIERTERVLDLTRSILASPTTSLAEQLDARYERAVDVTRDRASKRRTLMAITALAIAALLAADVVQRFRRDARRERETAEKLSAANAALLRDKLREKELSDLKGRFVTMTSHEFRTPLSVILSSIELLEAYGERWPPAKRSDHYVRVKTAVGTMRELLDAVLVIGRSDAGRLECKPGPLDIPRFVRESVDAVASTTMKHELRVKMPESLPPAQIDEKLAVHVFTNLLSNAVKYSPAGGPIDVVLRVAGPDLVLSVRDRGIGISATDRARLFESFHRGNNVGTIPGTGLGLAVVKRAVDAHGGSIDVTSAEGEGTTFTVRLPVFVEAGAQRAAAPERADSRDA
jgi:signal transduction histidine kinase